MTILGFIIAIVLIVTIFWAVFTYMPSAPPPLNILKWIIYIILIVILFAMLFDVLGWVNIGGVFNRRIS